MFKKLAAVLLSMATILVLIGGCNNAPSSSTGGVVSVKPGEDPVEAVINQRKESGQYPKIVMAAYNWTGTPAGLDRINKLMSDYTVENLGIEFEFIMLDSASFTQNIRMMLSSGEKLDLFQCSPFGYSTVVSDGYCYDLETDDLIQTYGKGVLDGFSEDEFNSIRINGSLYGLPNKRDLAIYPFCIMIGEEYLDGINFDYDSLYEDEYKEMIFTDLDTINEIFAQLHEKYPDKYVFSTAPNLISQGSTVDLIGGDNFGVLLDAANSLKVENLFESEVFYDRCNMVYEWNKLGYISQDAISDDTAVSARVKSGAYMSMLSQGKPGYKTQISGECGRPMVVFCLEEGAFRPSNTTTSLLWCINQNVEDPVAAMQIYNAFFTDEYLSNLMCWGEEGKEYVKTEDGHITFPEGVDAQNSEYYNIVNWELPNQFIAHVWEGDTLDIWDRTEEFNESAVKSKAIGFTFDKSKYSSQFTALSNVYDEYEKQLQYGFADPSTTIPEMMERLNAAGLQEYMQAKQDALDKWAEETGAK